MGRRPRRPSVVFASPLSSKFPPDPAKSLISADAQKHGQPHSPTESSSSGSTTSSITEMSKSILKHSSSNSSISLDGQSKDNDIQDTDTDIQNKDNDDKGNGSNTSDDSGPDDDATIRGFSPPDNIALSLSSLQGRLVSLPSAQALISTSPPNVQAATPSSNVANTPSTSSVIDVSPPPNFADDSPSSSSSSDPQGIDQSTQATSVDQGTESEQHPRIEQDQQGHDDHNLVSGHIPGERGLIKWPLSARRFFQTMAVFGHTISIAACITVFFFCSINPLFWPLIVPYLLWINYFSSPGSNGSLRWRTEFIRNNWFWTCFAGYFPAVLHKSEDLPRNRRYLFGYHPHGIISHGAFIAFATEACGFSELFPGITNSLLTLEANFKIPFYRDFALLLGLRSVSRDSCEKLLTTGGSDGMGMGRAITIVVGGARESLEAQPNTLRLILKNRRGFVKLAIRTGADLVPVLGFGENNLYHQLDGNEHPTVRRLQKAMKKWLGWTLPIYFARGLFSYDVGPMPFRVPLNITVGRRIPVIKQTSPNEAYVEELHKQYVAELIRIWQQWKDQFLPGCTYDLEFVVQEDETLS